MMLGVSGKGQLGCAEEGRPEPTPRASGDSQQACVPGTGVGRGHNVYMVERVGIVGGRYVTDVQGRRSDGGDIVVQKTRGERVRLRRPACVPPLL